MKLIIEKRDQDGLLKRWQVDDITSRMTIGSSPSADIHVPDESLPAFFGMLEWKDAAWQFVDLRQDTLTSNSVPLLKIAKDLDVPVGNHLFHFEKIGDNPSLFDSTSPAGTRAADGQVQVFVLLKDEERIAVAIQPMGQAWKSPLLPEGFVVNSIPSQVWTDTQTGEFTVRQRTYSTDSQELKALQTAQHSVNSRDKKYFQVLVGSFLGLIALVGFSALQAPESQVAFEQPDFEKIREIQLPEKKPKAKEKASAQAAASPSKANNSPSPTNSVKNSRITQLIGKIANSNLKSKHFVVGKGKLAGMGPSANAMNSLRNIQGVAVANAMGGAGTTVSTIGSGGGAGLGGLGKVQGSSAGTLGVGLLEDEGEVAGGLDREVIAQFIRERIGQILYCYERQLSATPDLFGKVSVKFTISGTGTVSSAKIGDTTLRNASVEGCVVGKISSWRFPIPDGGTQVLVTYPFFFKSTN